MGPGMGIEPTWTNVMSVVAEPARLPGINLVETWGIEPQSKVAFKILLRAYAMNVSLSVGWTWPNRAYRRRKRLLRNHDPLFQVESWSAHPNGVTVWLGGVPSVT